MPDSHTPNPAGDDPSKSGALKAVMPKEAGKPVATTIDVKEGTREHTVTVQQVPAGHAEGEGHHDGQHEGQHERRRQQSQTQVNFQPGSGGLSGWPNVLAQMTFATAFLFAFFLLYRDSKSDQREYMAQMREDRISERTQDQAANAAIIGAVTSLAAKIDARDIKLETAIEEARIARAESRVSLAEQRQIHQEMLTVLKAIRDRDKQGPEPDEVLAPMPRKVNGT